MQELHIVFGQNFHLVFDIERNDIADLWLSKMQNRGHWPLDDPERFYGLNSLDRDREIATEKIRDCISIINSYQHVIEKPFTSIDDQDMLNYLHNIFERYHGLLDKQNNDWWAQAPQKVRESLAVLNINVHRAENVYRGNKPRLVCTWWGMPKDSQLTEELMRRHGRTTYEFGGVYLNYVEIGKTLEDLSLDDDQYISDDAFQPFLKYSADFSVRFYDDIADIAKIDRYFSRQESWFRERGIISWQDYRTMPWRYKVARLRTDLSREEILARLSENQRVTDIYIA